MGGLRFSEREMRARAERVIAGTQSGTYKKIDLARDIITALDRMERMRPQANAYIALREAVQAELIRTRAPSRQRLREALHRVDPYRG